MIKKKKRKLKIFLFIVFAFVVLGVVLSTLRLSNSQITIEGNNKYTKEELINYLFSNNIDRNPFVLYYKTNYEKQKTIPFISQYEVNIKSLNRVKITVYEKSIIGYVNYMGYNMYFDRDGTVVESSDKILENIPKITGLKFQNIIINEKLPIDNQDIFEIILDISQGLQKYSIDVDKLNVAADNQYNLYIGDIVVQLGDGDELEDKLRTLKDMMDNLNGLKGTLDMKKYDETGMGYTFKKSE